MEYPGWNLQYPASITKAPFRTGRSWSHILTLSSSSLTGDTQQLRLVTISSRTASALIQACLSACKVWPLIPIRQRDPAKRHARVRLVNGDKPKPEGSSSFQPCRPNLVFGCVRGVATVTSRGPRAGGISDNYRLNLYKESQAFEIILLLWTLRGTAREFCILPSHPICLISFFISGLAWPHSNSETYAISIAAYAGTPGRIVQRDWRTVPRSCEGGLGWHLALGGHLKKRSHFCIPAWFLGEAIHGGGCTCEGGTVRRGSFGRVFFDNSRR